MQAVTIRSEPQPRGHRRYLDLALESVKLRPPRRRMTTRLGLTDGPFAETKEKASGGL